MKILYQNAATSLSSFMPEAKSMSTRTGALEDSNGTVASGDNQDIAGKQENFSSNPSILHRENNLVKRLLRTLRYNLR